MVVRGVNFSRRNCRRGYLGPRVIDDTIGVMILA